MAQFGLIGYPLTHSFSKKYFTEKFIKEKIEDNSYMLFPIERIDDLSELLKSFPDLDGLNVTIPYKEHVIGFLDELDEEAKSIGAVNTIKIENGKLKGYNTDVYGFQTSLEKFIKNTAKEKKDISNFKLPIEEISVKELYPSIKALILGTGGASKAIAFILEKLGISYKFVSRRKKNNSFTYEEVDEVVLNSFKLIINTTPLGTFPEVKTAPNLPYEFLSSEHFLFDVVYNPAVSKFLKHGKDCGASIQNGLEMLHLQAEKSWEIWNE